MMPLEPLPAGADTIVAVASPPGSSAQAVVRLSGPAAIARVAAMAVEEGGNDLAMVAGFGLVPVVLDVKGTLLPARACVSRAPRSYTREDVVELVVPGSPPLLGLLLGELTGAAWHSRPTGAEGRARVAAVGVREGPIRWASPGEFTLRAFLNGRIDLSQAESVAGAIGASGEAEAWACQRGLRGELRETLERTAQGITEAIALCEAALDFPDEDLPEVSPPRIGAQIEALSRAAAELRRSSKVRLSAAGTLRVVLAGFPNAGKSSLLNAILARDVALVAPFPGTTRDPVRGATIEDGRRVEWIDLAGTFSVAAVFSPASFPHRSSGDAAVSPVCDVFGAPGVGEGASGDPAWEIARRLTRAEIEGADRILWVVDPTGPVGAALSEYERLPGDRRVLVVQKADLLDAAGRSRVRDLPGSPLVVSALRRQGIDELIDRVLSMGAAAAPSAGTKAAAPPRFLLSAHQDASLRLALESLDRARAGVATGLGYELVAADLRDAAGALEDLTGKVTADAVLAHVFSAFCVGK